MTLGRWLQHQLGQLSDFRYSRGRLARGTCCGVDHGLRPCRVAECLGERGKSERPLPGPGWWCPKMVHQATFDGGTSHVGRVEDPPAAVVRKQARSRILPCSTPESRQLPFESPEQYYYDVLQLCAIVNSITTEEDRLRDLLRGLRSEVIEKVILAKPTTCADSLRTLQRLKQASMMSQPIETTTCAPPPANVTVPSALQTHYPVTPPTGLLPACQILTQWRRRASPSVRGPLCF